MTGKPKCPAHLTYYSNLLKKLKSLLGSPGVPKSLTNKPFISHKVTIRKTLNGASSVTDSQSPVGVISYQTALSSLFSPLSSFSPPLFLPPWLLLPSEFFGKTDLSFFPQQVSYDFSCHWGQCGQPVLQHQEVAWYGRVSGDWLGHTASLLDPQRY